jgi:predicted DNA-binding protein
MGAQAVLRMPIEMREALDALAERDGRTTSNLIRRIIAEWLAAQTARAA